LAHLVHHLASLAAWLRFPRYPHCRLRVRLGNHWCVVLQKYTVSGLPKHNFLFNKKIISYGYCPSSFLTANGIYHKTCRIYGVQRMCFKQRNYSVKTRQAQHRRNRELYESNMASLFGSIQTKKTVFLLRLQ